MAEEVTAAGRFFGEMVAKAKALQLFWLAHGLSIFSLKNEPEGGSEAIRRRASFLGVFF